MMPLMFIECREYIVKHVANITVITQGTYSIKYFSPSAYFNREVMIDRMKLVRDLTISIILPSGKNILVNFMLKTIIRYTKLGTWHSVLSLSIIPI